ncbi:DUF2867 domain-containing protein [Pragia fontium]|uniref:Uncharacterized conserved protein YbjT, contains NAD(P)-binding and DUF2867 domains n=1 Tax=Pragia fontium DSM 5563 = ATCC 49100 TaxID=1122977 RepID=A0AAJ4WC76_9GAMM|nr:DUF2867 domain-containing protein [Pragia fontium]SFD14419.1 Uncharacterized conserved protein YbjT, contains NAD(P)-binding and DUF2867 domains [Pragia fontium DSM 5563 = ATCC 49100]SUB82993.1 Putative NADH-flavin reductase [Pragia fontium]VEJ55893.1 Putative NADH-flavin reductase [Pragia fontium]
MTPQRILVLGASGYIGQNLIPYLSAQGHQVTAAARRIEWLKEQQIPNVTCRYIDLFQPSTIPPVLNNIDVVYYLVHSMGEKADFLRKEKEAAQNLQQALRFSNVKQIIFLGAIQPKEGSTTQHLLARKLTGEALRASGIPVTELRAGIIIGAGSAAFEVMRDMVYSLPILTPPRWVRSKSSPIALENLLVYLTEILNHPSNENRIFDVAGPEYISYQNMFERFIAITGKKRLLIPIPFPTRLISVYWLNMITTVPTTTAKALIEGLKHNLPADSEPLQALIPQKLINYEEAVLTTMHKEQSAVNSADWGYDPEARARWRPGYAFYPKHAGYTLRTTASAESIWQVMQQIGGEEGYFYANYLWNIRGWMDDIIGGENHYGRPDTQELKVGDRIDSWRVISIKPLRQLAMLFGMKAPGLGRLTLNINDTGQYREIDVRAWWHPAGFGGLLYWFIMMPAHLFIFKGMAKRIAFLSEQLDRQTAKKP